MITKAFTRVLLLGQLLHLVISIAHAQGSTAEFPSLMRPLADSDVSISSLQLPSDADVVKAAGMHLFI